MKKIVITFLLTLLLTLSVADVNAAAVNEHDSEVSSEDQLNSELASALQLDELYASLPAEALEILKEMGVSTDTNVLSDVTFSTVVNGLLSVIVKQGTGVLSSLGVILAVLLLYSLAESFSQSITEGTMKEVLSVVAALCIACALVIPVTDIIDTANEAIVTASDFMLAFLPIMLAVLISCGKSLSGSGYYSLMIFAAEGIAQLSAKLITPLLNVFLGVSICSTVVPHVRLDSVTDLFAKTIKWTLSFSFTIFSALLTFKTLISTSIDSVSTRAVRFTMSSFIPVVGAALSEAYKTVQGSVNILKNGIGVFVIFAVAVVFLPVILRLTLWSFSVSICKTFAQMLNLNLPMRMLTGVSTVLSVLLAVLLCIMSLFIISTALIISAGGYNQ